MRRLAGLRYRQIVKRLKESGFGWQIADILRQLGLPVPEQGQERGP